MPVQSADMWVGEYGGTSGCMQKNTQCWLDIRLTGKKTYSVDLIVADRFDAKKIKCKITGKGFKRGKSGGLVGKWEGHKTEIIGDPTNDEGLAVYGHRWSDGEACDFLVSRENFFEIGD